MTQNLPAKKDSKELSIIDVTADIESIIAKVTDEKLPDMQKAVNMAFGIEKLKRYFLKNTELQKVTTSLAGSALGFKTDKQYSPEIVTDVCIAALLSGYRLHGNEFNIISGNFYPAKAGKFRKIIETPGLTNFREHIGMPEKEGQQARVSVGACWKLNGNHDEFEGDVIVKIFANSDTDYIIGKAQSKLYSRVLTQLTGTFLPDADVDTKRGVNISKEKPTQEPEVIETTFEQVDDTEKGNRTKPPEEKQEKKQDGPY